MNTRTTLTNQPRKATMKLIPLAIVTAITLAACGTTELEGAIAPDAGGTQPAEDTAPPTTDAPIETTTTSTTTTEAPESTTTTTEAPETTTTAEAPLPQPVESGFPPFVDYGDGSFEICGMFYAEDIMVSDFLATDYDDYCEMFTIGLAMGTDPEVCQEFYITSDQDILELFMSIDGGGHSFSGAIGLLDSVWANCG